MKKTILIALTFSLHTFAAQLDIAKIPIELSYLIDCNKGFVLDSKINDRLNSLKRKQMFFLIKSEFYKHIFSETFLPSTYRGKQVNWDKNIKTLEMIKLEDNKFCAIERLVIQMIRNKKDRQALKAHLLTWSNYLALKYKVKSSDLPQPNYKELFNIIIEKLTLFKNFTHKPSEKESYLFEGPQTLNEVPFESSEKDISPKEEIDKVLKDINQK